ncbi:LysR family transcriptional regulator [Brevibacillus sp. B_LB10_24]|uniref:LysR family transcriptional regulator n=1 Tax=Brevibacillus sp. B_LB10_24 TaxID=3380645 RepID=UPI0038B8B288
MDEKDFIMLQYIHEEQHITKAAERLYMTQPALTYRLQQLEKELGIQILIKNGKKITFTPEGEYLVSFAHKMLFQFRQAKEHLTNMADEVQGTLKIAVASIFARYYLSPLLKKFVEQYPKVVINVYTGLSPELMELLDSENVHLALVRGDYKWPGEKHLVTQENLCLVSKNPINLELLPYLQQIQYRATDKASRSFKFTSNTPVNEQIQHWWTERYEVPPLTTMQVDSYETCKEIVKNDLGYAFIPRIFLNPTDNLYTLDLITKDGSVIKRNTWMHYKESSTRLKVVDKFIQFIKSQNLHSRWSPQ